MLFLHNTSRVDDEPYPDLLREKGFRGFPSLCFMSADGTVLTQPARSVASFRETHTKTAELMALRTKGEARTAAENRQLFLAELALGLIPAEQIQARADAVEGLSDADRAVVAQKLVDAEVQAILQRAREAGPEQTAKEVAELARTGKRPSDAMARPFWLQVLRHASAEKDTKLAQQAHREVLNGMKGESGPQFERFKQQLDELLAAAKK